MKRLAPNTARSQAREGLRWLIPALAFLSLLFAALATSLPSHASQAHAANLMSSNLSQAIPLPNSEDSTLHFLGEAELRWFGLKIYQAQLWAADLGFDGNKYGSPVMLSIEYSKNIKRKRLLSTTKKEWKKLGRTERTQQDRWLQQLEQIWPDVTPGDMIASIVIPGKETRFYDHDGLLGVIKDPDFGPEFLAIWLDSNSRMPKLRNRLLGTTQI